MKKILSTILFILIFLTGFSVMMYPTVSNWLNERNSSRVVSSYGQVVAEMKEEDFSVEWEAAREYNKYLEGFGRMSDAVRAERADKSGWYEGLLNVGGSEVMGVLKIPKINVSLPIYHTTDDSVLQAGVGHYEGSSLPVGGENTHSVLSGHRGLPSAKMLTDLDQMGIGDRFYITVLDEVLAYETEDITIVMPDDVDEIVIEPGEDLVTLVTCTPYGLNTHRLLVTGRRVPYTGEMEERGETAAVEEEPYVNPAANDKKPLPPYIYMGGAVAAAAVLGLVVRGVSDWRYKRRKARKSNNSNKENGERS